MNKIKVNLACDRRHPADRDRGNVCNQQIYPQNGGSLDTVAVTQMPVTAGGGIPQAYSEGAGAETPAAAKKRMAAASHRGGRCGTPGNTGEAVDRAAVPEPASSRIMAAEGAAAPAPESFLMDSDEVSRRSRSPGDSALAGPGSRDDAAAVPSISR